MTTEKALPATSVVVSNRPTSNGSIFLGISEDHGRQGGNLLEVLHAAISEARAAETDIKHGEAIDGAVRLLEQLCDSAVTCRCGGLLDRLTGICPLCVERRTQLDAEFARIDTLLLDIDEAAGF